VAGCFGYGNEHSASIKREAISFADERLSTYDGLGLLVHK
jgi:hypothetical protein